MNRYRRRRACISRESDHATSISFDDFRTQARSQGTLTTAHGACRARFAVTRAFTRKSIRERFEAMHARVARPGEHEIPRGSRLAWISGDTRTRNFLSDVRGLIGSQRELTARLVVYLAEIEHRRLHLVAGFSSMFEFCVKALHLSEGEAFRRLAAHVSDGNFPSFTRSSLPARSICRRWPCYDPTRAAKTTPT